MSAKLGHVILSVSDFKKSVEFYDKLMLPMGYEVGLNEDADWGGLKSYEPSEGSGLYIQHEKDQEYRTFERFPGLNHVALSVDTKEEVDRVHEVVKALGTKVTREPKDYPEYSDGYYAFFFRDPDGIPLEVMTIVE